MGEFPDSENKSIFLKLNIKNVVVIFFAQKLALVARCGYNGRRMRN